MRSRHMKISAVEVQHPALADARFGEPVTEVLHALGVPCVDNHGPEFTASSTPLMCTWWTAPSARTVLLVGTGAFEGGSTAFWKAPPRSLGVYFDMHRTWGRGRGARHIESCIPRPSWRDAPLCFAIQRGRRSSLEATRPTLARWSLLGSE